MRTFARRPPAILALVLLCLAASVHDVRGQSRKSTPFRTGADRVVLSKPAGSRQGSDQDASAAEHAQPTKRPYMPSSHAHGVHQFDIPATMHVSAPLDRAEVQDRRSEGVVLHLWLKGIRGREETHWRGLAFAESVEHLWLRDNMQLSQSPLFDNWEPSIGFKSIQDGTMYSATVMRSLITFDWASDPRPRFMRPMPFNITLPNSLMDTTDFEIMVADTSTLADMEAESGDDPFWPGPDGKRVAAMFSNDSSELVTWSENAVNLTHHEWIKSALFSPGLVHEPVHEVPKPRTADEAPKAYLVLPPAYGSQPQIALDLLLHNAEYHLALGFAKVVRYCSPADLRVFLRNAQIHELLASDKLDLILWDSMAECRWHSLCTHPQILSHSLLAYWGMHVWLALADVDEFLALPPRWDVPHFMRKCFVPTALQVRLIRRNILCGDWPHTKKGRKQAELHLWTGASSPGAGKQAPHPLSHYTLRDFKHEPAGVIKSFAHPDGFLSYGMHGGVLPYEVESDPEYNVNEGELPPECEAQGPWWAHAMSLYSARDYVGKPGSDWRAETRWLENLELLGLSRPS